MIALGVAGLSPVVATAPTASSSTEQVPQPTDQTLDPVASEPQPPVEGGTDTGDIVVTAQRRSERLVQVPVAVTGDALASQQITDVQSLSRTIPSLTYQQGGAPNNSAFRVRGVGTSLFGQGVEPSVSVVVDGVVSPRAGSSFNTLADIERVEVLRGPQGTLFGKNATSGARSTGGASAAPLACCSSPARRRRSSSRAAASRRTSRARTPRCSGRSTGGSSAGCT